MAVDSFSTLRRITLPRRPAVGRQCLGRLGRFWFRSDWRGFVRCGLGADNPFRHRDYPLGTGHIARLNLRQLRLLFRPLHLFGLPMDLFGFNLRRNLGMPVSLCYDLFLSLGLFFMLLFSGTGDLRILVGDNVPFGLFFGLRANSRCRLLRGGRRLLTVERRLRFRLQHAVVVPVLQNGTHPRM
jgi:hypothetical protein